MRGEARLRGIIKRLRLTIDVAGNKLIPERTINYHGYKLSYSAGTSIVERYKRDGSYEEEVCVNLEKIIANTPNGTFIDIGANVGLISLRLLAKNPKLKIHAFEPGPHQYKLLKKTIQDNNLQPKVKLYSKALSDKRGSAIFSIHRGEDASGDGFMDTGRAGKTTSINVKTETLDNWWESKGKPQIDLIKIDTEGAEMLILKGAKQLIATCKPTFCLEIWPINLKNYPYDAYDIYEMMKKYGYRLETQDGIKITDKNYPSFVNRESDFIAYARKQKK